MEPRISGGQISAEFWRSTIFHRTARQYGAIHGTSSSSSIKRETLTLKADGSRRHFSHAWNYICETTGFCGEWRIRMVICPGRWKGEFVKKDWNFFRSCKCQKLFSLFHCFYTRSIEPTKPSTLTRTAEPKQPLFRAG